MIVSDNIVAFHTDYDFTNADDFFYSLSTDSNKTYCNFSKDCNICP
jgi:hypothetical protein